MKVTFKIFRFNPETDQTPHYDIFTVEGAANDRLLDCLNRIRWEQDGSLAFRMSCAHGICGSDGLTINGVSALACQKLVKDFDYSKEILVEPLKFFPVKKDLIVDMEPFFARIKAIQPSLPEETHPELPQVKNTERVQSPDERKLFDDSIKCIFCACCVAACPVNLKEEPEFIGPAALLRAQRYLFDSRTRNVPERMKLIEQPHGVWSCKSYYQCTRVCPKGIRVTEAILRIKKKILQEQASKQEEEG
jgi:succinate dehydrogenase / fumarate reductase iron-sulfur subunit